MGFFTWSDLLVGKRCLEACVASLNFSIYYYWGSSFNLSFFYLLNFKKTLQFNWLEDCKINYNQNYLMFKLYESSFLTYDKQFIILRKKILLHEKMTTLMTVFKYRDSCSCRVGLVQCIFLKKLIYNRLKMLINNISIALVVELVDTKDLKSLPFGECRFESGRGHH